MTAYQCTAGLLIRKSPNRNDVSLIDQAARGLLAANHTSTLHICTTSCLGVSIRTDFPYSVKSTRPV